MRDTGHERAMHDYYQRGNEAARLDGPIGLLEYERTREILLRRLPPPPAVIADVGGGPGRYACWLAGLGYQIRHRDAVLLHVREVAAAGSPRIESAVGDARCLDLADDSVDAVLLLGPLYHLARRADRVAALAEARRVVRPGGPVFAAAISRWALRIDGVLRAELYRELPQIEAEADATERTGQMAPLHPGAFCGYAHRPAQLRREVTAAGLRVTGLVTVEGPAFLLADLAGRMADPDSRRVVLDTARALERVPELTGIGPHLLVTAERPERGDPARRPAG